MIKEPLHIEPHYFELSEQIITVLKAQKRYDLPKLTIGICGESGSGKTVTAQCLKQKFEEKGKKAMVLNMDSYFYLPPADNHNKRKKDLKWVGSGEVNLSLMSQHIFAFKNAEKEFNLPVVDYLKNEFNIQKITIEQIDIVIIEGVYTFDLDNLDFKIFLEADYKDTLETRKLRTREVYDVFVEQVLEIEHLLALKQKPFADLIVDKSYNIKKR